MTEPRWTPEQVRLISLYGTCERCGSPRDVRLSPGPDGGTWGEIACTANPCAPPPPPSADEVLAWAKAAEWKFTSYYKYRFTFTAGFVTPEMAFCATASVGDDAGDIYRFEVQDPMTWDEICCAGEPYLKVTGLDGKVIYEG